MDIVHTPSRGQNAFLDEWQKFTRPSLERMLIAGLSLVSAMEDYRAPLMWANDVTRHDAYAADQIGGLLDMLSDAVGAAQKAGDAIGIDVEAITLDRSELEAVHAKLTARACNRKVAA